jgi:hypothetical protein
MLSLLQIDSLGKRYGLLPSEVLRRADTFDVYVMDAAMGFELFQHKKQQNKGKIPLDMYSQDQLLDILNRNKPNDTSKS